MSRRFQLDRRTLLRGAGSVAIALPWLEAMAPTRSAQAAPEPAKSFIAVYTPGGTVLEAWRPSGGQQSFSMSPILEPLEPVRSHVLVLDGIDMKSAVGEQRMSGMVAWLTGTQQVSSNAFAKGPSIDQVLAPRLSSGKRFASLEMAVRWGTGRSRGVIHPYNIVNYSDAPGFAPIAPRLDPVAIWQELFGVLPAPDRSAWNKSILDGVVRRYERLATRLGRTDRQVMEAHLAKIRELELRLEHASVCQDPELVDTSDYDPFEGLNSAEDGSVRDPLTDASIPVVGKLMMDMLVMALACDLTSVATLQWSDAEAEYTLPWLNLDETHAFYQNDGGYHPEQLKLIHRWYSEQHAYLIEQLRGTPAAGGASLLDQCVLLFGSEVQGPADHSKQNMPFLLAGSGGGLQTGRYLTFDHPSHNDLLVAILNLCGDARTFFGDPEFCAGALGGLT